jgi:hypothetical protein
VGLLVVPGFTQQQAPQSTPPKTSEPAAGSLEDLLTQALKNNPDIRVGEAKVREAEAELHRTRMSVAQKVAALYYASDIARKARDEAEQRYRTSQRLYSMKGGVETEEGLRAAKLTWERAVADVAKLVAEMPALLGKFPGQLGEEKIGAAADPRTTQAVEAGLRWLQATLADDTATQRAVAALALSRIRVAPDSAPQGTLAEKIRKALDKPIEANYKDKLLTDVMKEFEKHLDGVPFRVMHPFPGSPKMDLNLGQVPLGTAIQAFNDLTPYLRFVVRDYGVLVTEKRNLPPGAVDLYDFWKSNANKEKPKGDSGEPAKLKQ